MSKKTEVPPIKLKEVLQLRQLGASWSEIQEKTKIDRRVAKRTYEEWETDQKRQEQEIVRRRFTAEAFHEHGSDLIGLGKALSNHLDSLPIGPDESRSAEQYISSLWKTSILEGPNIYSLPHEDMVRQIRSNERQNLMILNSLRDHTRVKIRWEALDEWKKSWDSCLELFNNLKIEGREEIMNILNKGTNSPEIERRKAPQPIAEKLVSKEVIDKLKGKEDAIQRLARTIVHAIWQTIVENKFAPQSPEVKVGYELVDSMAIFTEKELNEKLIVLCNYVVESLLKKVDEDKVNLVEQLHDKVHTMRQATDELANTLNRLALYPIILKTWCDLCPI